MPRWPASRRLTAARNRAATYLAANGTRALVLRAASPWLWLPRVVAREPRPVAFDPSRPQVLVVTARIPPFGRAGADDQLRQLLDLFRSLGWQPTIVPADMSRLEPYASQLEAEGVGVVSGHETPAAWLAREGARFALVVVTALEAGARLLPAVRSSAPRAPVVVHRGDLNYVRLERQAAIERSARLARRAARTREIELALAAGADAIVTVTPSDRARLGADLPGANAFVVTRAMPLPPAPPGLAGREGLLFVGSFHHAPNVDAAEYLLGDVLPAVRAAHPGVPVTLVGQDPPRRLRTRAAAVRDVRVTGWAPQVEPYLDAARVCLCPLRYGAGIKNKVLQAMAAGLPVVTTPIGVEGMQVTPGEHLLVADDAGALAAAAIRLLTDDALWPALAAAGRDYVARHHSPAVVRGQLQALLGALGLPPAATPAAGPGPASR